MTNLLPKYCSSLLEKDEISRIIRAGIQAVILNDHPKNKDELFKHIETSGLAGLKVLFEVMRNGNAAEQSYAESIAKAIKLETSSPEFRKEMTRYLSDYIDNPDSPIDDSTRTAVLLLAKMNRLKLI